MRAGQFTTLLAVLLAAVMGLAVLAGSASAANVSGKVFDDFNSNGLQDNDADGGAVDNGMVNVTVRAYNAANAVVASTTTDATGAYTLAAPAGAVRVEVQMP